MYEKFLLRYLFHQQIKFGVICNFEDIIRLFPQLGCVQYTEDNVSSNSMPQFFTAFLDLLGKNREEGELNKT
ncbi:Uncharacterized protein dnm_095190 [Desulfonema magnum]|uniref:Uncharacterized protein n=1 Tax=Desulfonema magnum TaxID=45655 RepID=A0A975GVA6_9BACT|nr:Uncharacterized protein dnm_095190 [Desulfonema magnum]